MVIPSSPTGLSLPCVPFSILSAVLMLQELLCGALLMHGILLCHDQFSQWSFICRCAFISDCKKVMTSDNKYAIVVVYYS